MLQNQDKPPPELQALLAAAEEKRAAARPAAVSAPPSRRTTSHRADSAGPFWDFSGDGRSGSMAGEAAGEPPAGDQGTVRLQRFPPSSWTVCPALPRADLAYVCMYVCMESHGVRAAPACCVTVMQGGFWGGRSGGCAHRALRRRSRQTVASAGV